MASNNKPSYNTVTVIKDDGTRVNVKRVALKDLETLQDCLDRLLTKFIEYEGGFGSIISDPEVENDLKTACSLLPIVGRSGDQQEYLNYEDIKENWEQLILLFFSKGLDVNTRELKSLDAGLISELHFFAHPKMLQKALQTKAAKQKEEESDSQS